ncbi:MAG TPA: hypothetical protein VG327_00075 [Mycobacterium sp.]|nr:hypothetical protein [Mycobacterium sp.]
MTGLAGPCLDEGVAGAIDDEVPPTSWWMCSRSCEGFFMGPVSPPLEDLLDGLARRAMAGWHSRLDFSERAEVRDPSG